jgi:flagellar biosynthesis/type III secretory pathway chaperone
MVIGHELGQSSQNREEESNERRVVETPPYLAETVRILMEYLQSCKDDNERMIKE